MRRSKHGRASKRRCPISHEFSTNHRHKARVGGAPNPSPARSAVSSRHTPGPRSSNNRRPSIHQGQSGCVHRWVLLARMSGAFHTSEEQCGVVGSKNRYESATGWFVTRKPRGARLVCSLVLGARVAGGCCRGHRETRAAARSLNSGLRCSPYLTPPCLKLI